MRRPDELLVRRGGGVELLRIPAALVGVAVGVRGALYDRGWLPVERLEVPVVSVGNLTAGGTGKTPMVAHVVNALVERGWRPGLLSRGYGARAGEGPSDEARLLGELLPGVPHVQDPDRARGGRALESAGVDVIVLDDGFQHRRLHRDLDLVLVDATRPYGLPAPSSGGDPVRAFLPRGLLREPLSGLARADAILVTRAGQVSAAELERLEAELQRHAPAIPMLRASHRPCGLRTPAGDRLPPESMAEREVELVSGIGNPQAFEATARALGARVVAHRSLPDHHGYGGDELAGLGSNGRWVVTTTKDAVKLPPGVTAPFVLEVELVIEQGAQILDALLESLPPGRVRRERASLHEGLHG